MGGGGDPGFVSSCFSFSLGQVRVGGKVGLLAGGEMKQWGVRVHKGSSSEVPPGCLP